MDVCLSMCVVCLLVLLFVCSWLVVCWNICFMIWCSVVCVSGLCVWLIGSMSGVGLLLIGSVGRLCVCW